MREWRDGAFSINEDTFRELLRNYSVNAWVNNSAAPCKTTALIFISEAISTKMEQEGEEQRWNIFLSLGQILHPARM